MLYLEAFNKAGVSLGRIVNATDVSYDERLNDGGQLQFNLNVTDAERLRNVLVGGFTEVYLLEERRDENGDLLIPTIHWGGTLLRPQEVTGTDTGTVTFYCKSWFHILHTMRLQSDRSFNNTNEGLILWTLLNEQQQRDFNNYGLNLGLNTTTAVRDRQYKRGDQLSNIFRNITEVIDGLDFLFAPNKSLILMDRIGDDRTIENPIEISPRRNVQVFGYTPDFDKIRNYIMAEGEGGVIVIETNEDSQGQHGNRDEYLTFSDISSEATLRAHASEYARAYGRPTEQYTISLEPDARPTIGEYGLGDIVNVRKEYGYALLNTTVRIYKRSISIGNDGGVNVRLDVESSTA